MYSFKDAINDMQSKLDFWYEENRDYFIDATMEEIEISLKYVKGEVTINFKAKEHKDNGESRETCIGGTFGNEN